MYSRKLSDLEIKQIRNIILFIQEKHEHLEGHDYSHIAEVVRYSIEIGEDLEAEIDPFLLICGSLFHDIGRVNNKSGAIHGLVGAAITEEYLEAIGVDEKVIKKISRIVTCHTPTSMLPPKSLEEKIVFDADALDRLGAIGVLRGIIEKRGSIEEILEKVIKKRVKDYELLYFDKSRKLGKKSYEETLDFIRQIQNSLIERSKNIEWIKIMDV